MKKSILSFKGAYELKNEELKTIAGAHGGPSWNSGHANICGKPSYPPCHQN